jgi:hypothetical protein
MNGLQLVRTAVAVITAKLIGLLKFSLVIGSQGTLFFSGICIASPLIGLFGGVAGTTLFFCANLCFRTLIWGLPTISILAFHIPGWCAGLYLASSHWLIRLFLPVLCIALFVLHPIGGVAWVYSLYWLIPVALFCIAHNSLFLHALGATFTAHAVGSVIWLYTTSSLTPASWIALMPLVALERLTYAAGMVVMQYVIVHSAHRSMQYTARYRRRIASAFSNI